MESNPIVSYCIFGGVLLLLIVGGILVRTKRFGGNKRVYKAAVLLSTDKEYGEFTDPNGVTHRGVTKMTLTFGFRNGTKKSFVVDNKMRGHCAENEWGNLMYEGDKLLKFETKNGEIGTKMYVPAKNSVFRKFQNK